MAHRTLLGAAMVAGAAALVANPAARAQNATFEVYGPGNIPCATYLNDRSIRINADGWILGFWTGLDVNTDSGKQVGHSTTARGIVEQIGQVCRVKPAEPLYKATREVFNEMKADGN